MTDLNDDLGPGYMRRRSDTDIDAIIERAQKQTAAPEPAAEAIVPMDAGPPVNPLSDPVAAARQRVTRESVEATGKLAGAATATAKDIGLGVIETPRAVAGGVVAAGREFTETLFQITQPLADAMDSILPSPTVPVDPGDIFEFLAPDDPESTTGGIVKGISQFMAGFLPALKATKALGAAKLGTAGRLGEAALAGSLADAAVIDEQETRIADLIQAHPALANPVTEFLATDPDDSVAEGKLKQGLEGLALGVAGDALFEAVKWMRRARAVRRDGGLAEDAVKEAGEEAAERALDVERGLSVLGDPTQPLIGDERAVTQAAIRFLREGEPVRGAKAGNINLARLDTPEDIDDALRQTAEIFEKKIDKARRGTISNETTRDLAEELGMTPEQLLNRRKGQAFNAEEALAARTLLASSADRLVQLAKAAQAPDAGPATMFAFRKQLALHSAIQQQVSGLTAEAGRALQAFRIPAGSKEQTVRQIMEFTNSPNSELVDDMARMVASLDDPQALNRFAREAGRATTTDMLLEAWINSLLSGPQTHAVNSLSNTIVALWQVPERWLAAGVRGATGGSGVAAGEARAQMFGMVQGLREGFRLFGQALRTGEPSDALSKLETRRHRAITSQNVSGVTGIDLENGGMAARAVDFMGEVFRLPGRFLMAEDEFFKAVGYRMELNARAFRQATGEGLEGREFASRVREIISDPPDDITLASIDAARYQTFTKELGVPGKALQRAINEMPALRLILPFVRTPANIMKFVGERTPLAPLSKAIRADIAAGGARRDLALSRIAMGSMVMAMAADMTMRGQITGGGVTDPELNATRRRAGWQPYSILVGDTYVSYNRLDPLGATLGIAADIAEIMGQTESVEAEELAAAGVMAVANNIVSKTYMSGIADVVEIFASVSPQAGVSAGERFVQRLGGTVIPTGIAQIERTMDPTLRDARGIVDQVRSRIPGYSTDLPPRRNLWGEPIILEGGLGPDIVSPLFISTRAPSPIDEEMLRLKLPIRMPPRTLGGIELSPQEYDRFVVLAGNEAKNPADGRGMQDALTALLDNPEYLRQSDGPDGGKALTIRRIVQAYRALAKQMLFQEIPDLGARVDEKKMEDVRALMPPVRGGGQGLTIPVQ